MSVFRLHVDHARLIARISSPANTVHEERLQFIYDGIRDAARRGSTMFECVGPESPTEVDLITNDLYMNGFGTVVLNSFPPKISVCW